MSKKEEKDTEISSMKVVNAPIKPKINLSCTSTFRTYCKGDIISNEEEIQKILSSEEKSLVVKFLSF